MKILIVPRPQTNHTPSSMTAKKRSPDPTKPGPSHCKRPRPFPSEPGKTTTKPSRPSPSGSRSGSYSSPKRALTPAPIHTTVAAKTRPPQNPASDDSDSDSDSSSASDSSPHRVLTLPPVNTSVATKTGPSDGSATPNPTSEQAKQDDIVTATNIQDDNTVSPKNIPTEPGTYRANKRKSTQTCAIVPTPPSKRPIERIWTDDEEFVLLHNLLKYKETNYGALPRAVSEYAELGEKLGRFSVEQLSSKIRSLKKKHVCWAAGEDHKTMSKHYKGLFILTDKVWGKPGGEHNGQGEKAKGKNVGKVNKNIENENGNCSDQPIFLRHFIKIVEQKSGISPSFLQIVLGMKFDELADLDEKAKSYFRVDAKRGKIFKDLEFEITLHATTNAKQQGKMDAAATQQVRSTKQLL